MPLLTQYTCGCPAGHPSNVSINECEGNRVCEECGHVLEENDIVAEVTFIEGSNGGKSAVGGRVTADNAGRHVGPGFSRTSGGSTAVSDARHRISQISLSLGISNVNIIDSAHRLYTLAYTHQLSKGKRKSVLCAACLYVALRREKQAVMLIELADLVGVSVFKLGTIFMHLRREFPSVAVMDDIDPSVYIARFVQVLQFGDKTRQVANDAMLLVQRMRVDWIADGRRPAGICGACLLIAARMHHFHRSVKEIIQVVKMSDATILQRLKEFELTQAASLSVSKFRDYGTSSSAVQSSLPPSFLRNRKRDLVRLSAQYPHTAVHKENGSSNGNEEIHQLLTPPLIIPSNPNENPEQLMMTMDSDDESEELRDLKSEIMHLARTLLSTPSLTCTTEIPSSQTLQLFDQRQCKKQRTGSLPECGKYLVAALNASIPQNAATLGTYAEMDASVPGAEIALPAPTSQVRDIIPMSKLIAQFKGSKAKTSSSTSATLNPSSNVELSDSDSPPDPVHVPEYVRAPDAGKVELTTADCALSDLDDDPEISGAIVHDEQVLELREQVWVHANREWMERQAQVQQLKCVQAKDSTKRSGQKRSGKPCIAGQHANAVDAVHGVIVRKLSAKINRASVQALLDPITSALPSSVKHAIVPPNQEDTLEEEYVSGWGVEDDSPFQQVDLSAMYTAGDDCDEGYECEVW